MAVCMEFKHADLMLEGIFIDLTELLDFMRVSKAVATDTEVRDLSTAEKLHNAVERLTQTVEEQTADISGAHFAGVQKQRGGAVFLHMSNPAGIAWLKAHMEDLLKAMGGHMDVIATDNSLPKGVLAKAQWIKPFKWRKHGQYITHAVFKFSTPWVANMVLELQHLVVEHVPTPVYHGMDWSEYRKHLHALIDVERCEKYKTVKSIEAAIQAVEEAFTLEMVTLWDTSMHLEHHTYEQRLLPDHPMHRQAWEAVQAYCKAVKEGKARYWVEWQEKLLDGQVWDIHKFLDATPSDRSMSRIPMLTHTKINKMMDRWGGVNEWGCTHNAKFGPVKYQVAGFSQHHIPAPFLPGKTLPEPCCHLHLSDGHVVKMSKTIISAAKLHWHEQSAAGIGTRDMRRLYLGICVPQILYAADIFLSPPAVNRSLLVQFTPKERREQAVVKKWCSIQQCMALAITGALHSTPTDVLDAYANLLPVTHLIDKVQAGAALHLVTLLASHPMHAAVKWEAEQSTHVHSSPLYDLMKDFHLELTWMEKI
ncbi:hypothetical protein DFH08DRAFT_965628 [Mycena albidolilacea]|uniref:Uncharacterized protein n=1 Tax=Mycena albidolilacea TaxID=1033008 RepID=A0AAD6ZRB3_9AGAR|nr:hypothetical protein DFH08DRAFT_965628 [Mycena albidolilacea]